MPRANRHSIPGQVWHLTHRCHKQQWLLKFSRDRLRWIHWLFKTRQRYGLCVLNYMVTSNHVHLLVQDQGQNEIPKSMQLLAGRTAQEFNQRKNRCGAFWEDRYHATAVQTDAHLARCMTYIDLNMVRAGAVSLPQHWKYCAMHEMLVPPQRKGTLNLAALLRLFEQSTVESLVLELQARAEEQIRADHLQRETMWSDSVAVGDEAFVENLREQYKLRYPGLKVESKGHSFTLRERAAHYSVHSDTRMHRLTSKYSFDRSIIHCLSAI